MAGNLYLETTLYLSKVLIKLATKIGKAVVIGRLENDISRYLDSIQDLYLKPRSRNGACLDVCGTAGARKSFGESAIDAFDH